MRRLMPAGWGAGPAGLLLQGRAGGRRVLGAREGPGEMLLHPWPAVFSRLGAVWSRGGEGLGAVLPLSWWSGVHGTHSEASLAFLLQNGSESHISKSSRCIFPKLFD